MLLGGYRARGMSDFDKKQWRNGNRKQVSERQRGKERSKIERQQENPNGRVYEREREKEGENEMEGGKGRAGEKISQWI